MRRFLWWLGFFYAVGGTMHLLTVTPDQVAENARAWMRFFGAAA